jgi:hypothetical protein
MYNYPKDKNYLEDLFPLKYRVLNAAWKNMEGKIENQITTYVVNCAW